MARIAEDTRDAVRAAVDMADLVGRRTDLRRAGGGRMEGLCPFHDERTPSFGIDLERKLYHCFGCGVGGDCFDFVRETEGVSFGEAVELLGDRYGVPVQRADEDPQAEARRRHEARLLEILDRAASFYARMLWESREAADARDYLLGRGLAEATLRDLRVGYAPRAWDALLTRSQARGYQVTELVEAGVVQRSTSRGDRAFDRFRRRVLFPLTDLRGRVRGFGARALDADQQPKYMNTSDNAVFRKGRLLFAGHLARAAAARSGRVVLCEGYTDVAALHQAGETQAVAAMGTALTPEQARELARMAGTVVLALDADGAGRAATEKAAGLLGEAGAEVRVAAMPEGRDPADLLADGGLDAVREAVGRTVALPRFRVERALSEADLATSEGREAALARLGPVLTAMPPGIGRMDLLAEAAGRLGLEPGVLADLLAGRDVLAGPAPSGVRPGAARAGAGPAGPGSAAGRPVGGASGGRGAGRAVGGPAGAPAAPPGRPSGGSGAPPTAPAPRAGTADAATGGWADRGGEDGPPPFDDADAPPAPDDVPPHEAFADPDGSTTGPAAPAGRAAGSPRAAGGARTATGDRTTSEGRPRGPGEGPLELATARFLAQAVATDGVDGGREAAVAEAIGWAPPGPTRDALAWWAEHADAAETAEPPGDAAAAALRRARAAAARLAGGATALRVERLRLEEASVAARLGAAPPTAEAAALARRRVALRAELQDAMRALYEAR